MSRRPLAYDIDRNGAKKAAAFHATLAIGFLAIGAAAWWLPAHVIGGSTGPRLLVSLVAVFGAGLFGSIATRFARRLRSDKPLVVLETEGIRDYGSGVFSGLGWIPWPAVEEIRVGRYHNLSCVEIVLRDREAVLRRLPWFERLGRSARLGYPSIAFRGPLVPKDPRVMVAEMRAFLRTVRDQEPS